MGDCRQDAGYVSPGFARKCFLRDYDGNPTKTVSETVERLENLGFNSKQIHALLKDFMEDIKK